MALCSYGGGLLFTDSVHGRIYSLTVRFGDGDMLTANPATQPPYILVIGQPSHAATVRDCGMLVNKDATY